MILNIFKKWKLVDTTKYNIIPGNTTYFWLSDKENEDAKRIRKEKGDISYIFTYTGIGISLKVKVIKTGEIIDITDYSTW